MEPAVILAIAVLAPTALAVLALRFGVDTRPALRSFEDLQIAMGVNWYGAAEAEGGVPREPKLLLRRSDTTRPAYPTLHLLDTARGDGGVTFAADPNAQTLERHARALADDHWPEHVWLTGLISPAQLAAVTGPLDAERQRGLDAIRLLVATEPSTTELPAHPAP